MPLNRGRIVANKKPCKLFVNNLQGLNVIPLGLEPKTVCLEGRCSIQLSYGTIATRCKDAKLKCIIFNQIA